MIHQGRFHEAHVEPARISDIPKRFCEVNGVNRLPFPRGTRAPRISTPPLHVTNISPALFDLGIEEHRVEGQTVRIYSLARTVAEYFRFRNKIGLDVALEALTNAWRRKRLNLDELNRSPGSSACSG